jgi:hypothetical protein
MSPQEDMRFARRLRKMIKVLRDRRDWLVKFAPDRKADTDAATSAIELLLARAEADDPAGSVAKGC